MVGAERFELPTLCSQSRCATRLRYAPTFIATKLYYTNRPICGVAIIRGLACSVNFKSIIPDFIELLSGPAPDCPSGGVFYDYTFFS
jgi:hypothetical protein